MNEAQVKLKAYCKDRRIMYYFTNSGTVLGVGSSALKVHCQHNVVGGVEEEEWVISSPAEGWSRYFPTLEETFDALDLYFNKLSPRERYNRRRSEIALTMLSGFTLGNKGLEQIDLAFKFAEGFLDEEAKYNREH